MGNAWENLAYQTKTVVTEEKNQDKIDEEEKKKVLTAIEEALAWIEESAAEATGEEIKERKKSLESIIHPVMEKLYKAGGGGGGAEAGEQEDTEDL